MQIFGKKKKKNKFQKIRVMNLMETQS